MSASVADLEQWLDAMMKKKSVKSYKLDISGNTSKGDGYLGEITFLKAITPEETYNLVVKSAKKSETLRKQTPIKEAYEREIFMYTKVIPNLIEYQIEKSVDNVFDKFPKCHSVSNVDFQEVLILDNIKFKGYELHDRTAAMNFDHAKLVFQNYAQFHALSFGLRAHKPAIFKSLTQNMSDVFGKFFTQGNFYPAMILELKRVMALLRDGGRDDAARKYAQFEQLIPEITARSTFPERPTSVILHGDCWNNNMMFKYAKDGSNKPTDLIFLDFQLSRLASPVFDLSYYLYTCTAKPVLDEIDSLLDAYHESLTKALAQLGLDSAKIFPMAQLKEHWIQFGKYGLCLALIVIRLELADENEAPDFENSASNGDMDTMFDFKLKRQDLYDERMKDIYLHYAEKFM